MSRSVPPPKKRTPGNVRPDAAADPARALAIAPADLEETFAAARRLLAAADPDAAARAHLWQWLEGFRSQSALLAVSESGREAEWCEIVVAAIRALDLTVGELFRRRAAQYDDRTLFVTLEDTGPSRYSWAYVRARVEAIARGLAALRTGDAPIILYAANSLPTALCDLACLTRGLVNAVIPGTATTDHLRHILAQTRAEIALVGDADHYQRVVECGQAWQDLRHVVILDDGHPAADDRLIALRDLEQRGAALPERWAPVKADDQATVMFTSGTTGQPKGICFTHLNLVCKRFARAVALPFVGEDDVLVCYLPLYHTFGRWLEMLGTIFWGGTYVFSRSPAIRDLLAHMRQMGVTGFISVPQKWLQLRDEVANQVNLQTASAQEVRQALAHLTGGKLHWGLSAAGHLEPEIFQFFQRHGVELLSGFGMTEATGGITMTPPGHYVEGTVGKALPGIELRVAEDGELLIRGPYVSLGTYGGPGGQDTRRVEDWFATGDIVTMDRQGLITIVDRKKDIYKNLRGETIAPQRIENLFADFPGVARVFVVGDHRPYNTLLIVPDYTSTEPDLRHLSAAELEEFFRSSVVAVNRFLAEHERIVDFAVLGRDFTAGGEELTAKGTLRRRVIESRYADVIEPMYRRRYLELTSDGLTVQVPHWFLRAMGVPEAGVWMDRDGLVLAERGKHLVVRRSPEDPRYIRLGSLTYETPHERITLDTWLRNPSLWAGNADLVAFAGAGIAGWRSTGSPEGIRIRPEYRHSGSTATRRHPPELGERPAAVMLALHDAAAAIAEPARDDGAAEAALHAVQHLADVIVRGTHEYVALARERLAWAAYHESFAVRSSAYRALLRGEIHGQKEGAFHHFVASGRPFLDDATIEAICRAGLDDDQLTALRERLEWYRTELAWPLPDPTVEQFRYLLDLLADHGLSHPSTYAAVRSELAGWQLFSGDRSLRYAAERCLDRLVRSFRLDYAPPKPGDPDGRRTAWDTILEFELGIDIQEQARIRDAFATTCLLWEAIHVLYGGRSLTRDELGPGSIWISQRGGRYGTSLHHVIVETRQQEQFEFDLCLNRSQSALQFYTTELIRTAYGDLPSRPPGIARLGGLWPELGLATREHVAGETLEAFWERTAEQGDALEQYASWQCKHHLRLALAACVDFWHRTRRTLMLAAPSPRDVIIPAWQVTRTVRLFNIANRVPFTDEADLLLGLYRGFYRSLSHQCPALRQLLDPALILEALMDVLGEDDGREVAARALAQLHTRADIAADPKAVLAGTLRDDAAIRKSGFRPLPLRAAVQRYERWLPLNPAATWKARLETVIGLYRWHNLRALEDQYPEVRFRLFRETVWAEAKEPLARALDQAVQALRGAADAQQQILRRVSELRLDADLSAEDDAYLTWVTYPHLDPGQKARLVSVESADRSYSPLSTTITDATRRPYEVRGANSPREVARLTWLFRRAGLTVPIQPQHEVLVVLDDRQVIVGGVIYACPSPGQAFIRGVVVAANCQGTGLGRALVQDLLARLQGESTRIVTVDFVLPDFWRALGFSAYPEYGGLVKMLEEAPPGPPGRG